MQVIARLCRFAALPCAFQITQVGTSTHRSYYFAFRETLGLCNSAKFAFLALLCLDRHLCGAFETPLNVILADGMIRQLTNLACLTSVGQSEAIFCGVCVCVLHSTVLLCFVQWPLSAQDVSNLGFGALQICEVLDTLYRCLAGVYLALTALILDVSGKHFRHLHWDRLHQRWHPRHGALVGRFRYIPWPCRTVWKPRCSIQTVDLETWT